MVGLVENDEELRYTWTAGSGVAMFGECSIKQELFNISLMFRVYRLEDPINLPVFLVNNTP